MIGLQQGRHIPKINLFPRIHTKTPLSIGEPRFLGLLSSKFQFSCIKYVSLLLRKEKSLSCAEYAGIDTVLLNESQKIV